MNKSFNLLLTLSFLFIVGCNNAEKQKADNEQKLYAQLVDSLKCSIDTLTWHEEYSFQGKGNKSVDSVNLAGPFRLSYVFQGGNNASLTVNREENGELTVPLLVLTTSKSSATVKKDSLSNASLKIINNNGRWALSFASLRYQSPLNKDTIPTSVYNKILVVQDSLLTARVNALDTIQPPSIENMANGLREWTFLANSNYIWNASPVFNLGNTTLKLQIEIDIPEEKWYWDFMNKRGGDGLLIELKNLATGRSTKIFQYKGKCGYHAFTKEVQVSAGQYQIEYEGIGDIAFNIYNLQ